MANEMVGILKLREREWKKMNEVGKRDTPLNGKKGDKVKFKRKNDRSICVCAEKISISMKIVKN